jgi:phosphoglycolate phosphatase-like HAD superfamily hydrolase
MAFKAILFDIDGTLVDSNEMHVDARIHSTSITLLWPYERLEEDQTTSSGRIRV